MHCLRPDRDEEDAETNWNPLCGEAIGNPWDHAIATADIFYQYKDYKYRKHPAGPRYVICQDCLNHEDFALALLNCTTNDE